MTAMQHDEDLDRGYKEMVSKSGQLHRAFGLKIASDYLGPATEYRDELLWRISKSGEEIPQPDISQPALLWELPGQQFISEFNVDSTALYLERLARMLP